MSALVEKMEHAGSSLQDQLVVDGGLNVLIMLKMSLSINLQITFPIN